MREATAKDNAMTDPKEAAREAIIQAALAVRDAPCASVVRVEAREFPITAKPSDHSRPS